MSRELDLVASGLWQGGFTSDWYNSPTQPLSFEPLTLHLLSSVKITELNLTHVDLRFQPDLGLLFEVENSSITLNFQRRILYWFL